MRAAKVGIKRIFITIFSTRCFHLLTVREGAASPPSGVDGILLPEAVKNDRPDNDETLYDVLPDVADSEQDESVSQHGDD